MYRLMIVDDEPSIRKGLVNFIEWSKLQCVVVCEASDGIEARDAISSTMPDIIITDINMPGINGIELSKYLYEHYPEKKIIMLTGYSDFSYAQSAVKYGAVDFVLKPTSTEQILNAVEKAKNLIQQERAREEKIVILENKVTANILQTTEKFLQDIIIKVLINPETIEKNMKELNIHFNEYYVMVFEIENSRDKDSNIKTDMESQSILSLKNILCLAYKTYDFYNILISNQLICTVILFNDTDIAQHMNDIITKCEEVISLVNNFTEFSISVGISNMRKNCNELPIAYNEALNALSNKFYNDSNLFLYSSYLDYSKISIKENETDKLISKIIKLTQSGNSSDAKETTNELFNKLKLSKVPIEHIKSTCIKVCSLCSELLSNYNSSFSEVLEEPVNVYKEIFLSTSIHDLYNNVKSIIDVVATHMLPHQRQSNYIIENVQKYIEVNYNKEMNLLAFARHVHVSSSYLSRLYKKETGETLTEAITKFRLEKAKELISNTDLKTYKIASLVGIDDPAYFSQTFKKYVGMSPTEYKYVCSNS